MSLFTRIKERFSSANRNSIAKRVTVSERGNQWARDLRGESVIRESQRTLKSLPEISNIKDKHIKSKKSKRRLSTSPTEYDTKQMYSGLADVAMPTKEELEMLDLDGEDDELDSEYTMTISSAADPRMEELVEKIKLCIARIQTIQNDISQAQKDNVS